MNPIYMDYNSTTPMDPRVFDAMRPCFKEAFGNAASRGHRFGEQAKQRVDEAREQIAHLAGCAPEEIVFTSGATESNNLALKGICEMYREKGNHIITQNTEHKAILDTCKALEYRGFRVTYVNVDSHGIVKLDELEKAITNQTILISVMFANNETGVIQPIADIARLAKRKNVLFHTDASQAFGKIPIDVEALGIDLMSISAHKMYGPQGVGALFVRSRNPRVRLEPQMHGGGHQEGLRSGTLNVAGIVGFGKACEIAYAEMEHEALRVAALRDQLRKEIRAQVSEVVEHGDPAHKLPGTLNLSFAFVEGETLLNEINQKVAVSSGSACSSAAVETSYVLKAMGVEAALAHTAIRFSLGKFNTQKEVEEAAKHVAQAVKRLRASSPLYDVIKEGLEIKK